MASVLTFEGSSRTSRPQIRSSATYGSIYTAGRPPWFNVGGEQGHTAFVIGIAGGSASGKSTVANRIIDSLEQRWVCQISQDSFYRPLGPKELEQAHNNEFDFDHPNALELDLLAETLRRLRRGERVDIPVYDFGTHNRLAESEPMYGASVVVLEGLFVFTTSELRELCDLKVFVDEDADIRLARRLRRDIAERGRDLGGVIKQYLKFVKPSFDTHIKPTMKHADLVIPRGASNAVAMDLLIKEVRKQLDRRGLGIRQQLSSMRVTETLPPSVRVVPPSPHVRALQTTLCNRNTVVDEFVWAADALMGIVFEHMLSTLPAFERTEIALATGRTVSGRRPAKRVVGVTVLRAGLAMEEALGRCVQAVPLGRILIQTNVDTGEPELHHASLPDGVKDATVVLLDPTVATGGAAMMAVRVLLDHGVAQGDIVITTLFSSLRGVHALAYAFPDVAIVTSSLDHKLDARLRLDPGVGNFADRYYSTTEASSGAGSSMQTPEPGGGSGGGSGGSSGSDGAGSRGGGGSRESEGGSPLRAACVA